MAEEGTAQKNAQRVQEFPGRMVFVSAKDEGKTVARKITGANLEGAVHGWPVWLFGVRATSINVAVKGAAIARSILNSGDSPTETICQPSFRENRNEVTTCVKKFSDLGVQVKSCTDTTELTVGGKSKIAVVAGAIAGQVREQHPKIGQDLTYDVWTGSRRELG